MRAWNHIPMFLRARLYGHSGMPAKITSKLLTAKYAYNWSTRRQFSKIWVSIWSYCMVLVLGHSKIQITYLFYFNLGLPIIWQSFIITNIANRLTHLWAKTYNIHLNQVGKLLTLLAFHCVHSLNCIWRLFQCDT